jgi:K+-sensing histidine kinase KdpD
VSPENCIRGGVDLFQVVISIADHVIINAPKNFSLNVRRESNALVLAYAGDVCWILFILMRNVKIANRKSGAITFLALHISNGKSTVIIQLADDGPGLPAAVRADLFGTLWRPSTASRRHGCGLAVARELAERNGGSLTLARTDKGTSFALTLPVFTPDVGGGNPSGEHANERRYHVY